MIKRNNHGQFIKGERLEDRTGKYINCKICGKERYIKSSHFKKGFGKYCSSKCYGISKKGVLSKKRNGEWLECSLEGCTRKKYFPLNLLKKATNKYCSREHRIESLKGKTPWNKGLPGLRGEKNSHWKGGFPKCKCGEKLSVRTAIRCSHCRNTSLEMKQRLLKERLKQQQGKSFTRIEQMLYDYLNLRKIKFEQQKVIEFYTVDAYIPHLNLVIEVDGEYWHSLPETIWRDKAKNTYLKKYGYGLIRLSESEMLSGKFKQKLKLF